MDALLLERGLAQEWGEAGRQLALERFSIERFVSDWMKVFDEVTC